jgi:hypothetical protein
MTSLIEFIENVIELDPGNQDSDPDRGLALSLPAIHVTFEIFGRVTYVFLDGREPGCTGLVEINSEKRMKITVTSEDYAHSCGDVNTGKTSPGRWPWLESQT